MKRVKEDTDIEVKIKETMTSAKLLLQTCFIVKGTKSFYATTSWLQIQQNNQKLVEDQDFTGSPKVA